jgi:hypothetical protein
LHKDKKSMCVWAKQRLLRPQALTQRSKGGWRGGPGSSGPQGALRVGKETGRQADTGLDLFSSKGLPWSESRCRGEEEARETTTLSGLMPLSANVPVSASLHSQSPANKLECWHLVPILLTARPMWTGEVCALVMEMHGLRPQPQATGLRRGRDNLPNPYPL